MPFYDNLDAEFNHEATYVFTPQGADVAVIEDRVNGDDTGPFARRVLLISKMERLLRKLCRSVNASDFAEDIRAKREAREMFRELDDTDESDEACECREDYRARIDADRACERYHKLRDNPELADSAY